MSQAVNIKNYAIKDSVVKARLEAIKGNISSSNSPSLWQRDTWKISIFVSSTFTDTHEERDYLMKELLPMLRERGRRNGIVFTFTDMRYGLKYD